MRRTMLAGLLLSACVAAPAAAAPAPTIAVVAAGSQSCEYEAVGRVLTAATSGRVTLEVRLEGRFVPVGTARLLRGGFFIVSGGPDQDRCFADQSPGAGAFRVRFTTGGATRATSPPYRTRCEIIGVPVCRPPVRTR
ncbi:MAG: hypothetical protein MUE51_15795 [Thermoleophilia bacterium]|nr:hypothetical protein [Thermoleophilia bacterium]